MKATQDTLHAGTDPADPLGKIMVNIKSFGHIFRKSKLWVKILS